MADEDENKQQNDEPMESDEEKSARSRDDDARSNNRQDMPLEWTQLGNTTVSTGNGNTSSSTTPAIRYPSDVAELSVTETEIILVGTAGQKITHMGKDFSRQVNPRLETLILRSHLIRTMEGLSRFECLQLLELYDNQVTELRELDSGEDGLPGKTLRVLDMSYNVIRDMAPVSFCPNLQELYLANNKLKSMAGLKSLSKLRKIDLGANRFRVMDVEELSGLVSLEELWLGKNKIEKIQGLECLTKLRRLDIQSNRLTSIENLTSQNDTLEELYLAHNGITTESSCSLPGSLSQTFPNLSVLDLSRNSLTNTSPFAHLTSLDELWLSGNKIATFEDVQPLAALGKTLSTVYLEYNPVQQDPLYRKQLANLIPSLTQIDANMITLANIPAIVKQPLPPNAAKPALAKDPTAPLPGETEEERTRRLQDLIIQRAKKETGQSD